MTRDTIRGFLIIIGLAIVATVFFNVSQQIFGIVLGTLSLLFIVILWYFGYSWYRSNRMAISLMPDRQRNVLYAGMGAVTVAFALLLPPAVRPGRPRRAAHAARGRRPGGGVRDVLGRAGVEALLPVGAALTPVRTTLTTSAMPTIRGPSSIGICSPGLTSAQASHDEGWMRTKPVSPGAIRSASSMVIRARARSPSPERRCPMPQFGRWPSVTPAGGPPSSAATTLSRARMWPIRCSESPSAIYHGVSIFQPAIAIYARPVAEWDRYTAQNRRAWNEIAHVRSRNYAGAAYPAEFFAAGGSSLDARVLDAVGDVRGRRLLHLMCATGEETLSWAVAGAEAVGVDISDVEIDLAIEKASAAGIAARFVAADVGALPPDLARGDVDVVYTATGVLVWIPDLARWADAIVAALAPGGRFVLFEEHPMAMCLWVKDGRVEIVEDYFDTGRPAEYEGGWAHFEGGEDAVEKQYEFGWTLGQVITALAAAGLRIERMDEYPTDSDYRFGGALLEARRLPGRFLLIARRD